MKIDPFGYQAYRAMLGELLAAHYRFISFTDPALARGGRVALLRHDVDFDLGKAADMAAVEAEMGIRSTYFFLLSSPHYNMLSREGTRLVRSVLKHGHWLGLHFDCAAYPGDSIAEFGRDCRREAETLERWFDTSVDIVSFHRPSPAVLTGNPAYAGGLVHTYETRFIQDMCYRSDSRSQWNEGLPTEAQAFERGEPLHILVHPIWWDDSGRTAVEKLGAYLGEHTDMLERSVEANCTIYSRRNARSRMLVAP